MWTLETPKGCYETKDKESLEKFVDRVARIEVENGNDEIIVDELYYTSNVNGHCVNVVGLDQLQKALDDAIEGWKENAKDNADYHRECSQLIYDRF